MLEADQRRANGNRSQANMYSEEIKVFYTDCFGKNRIKNIFRSNTQ